MAGRDQNKAFANGGRIAYGCTDLTAAWPHGGTGLGLVGEVAFMPPDGFYRLNRGESNSTETIVYTGGDAVLGFRVRSWHEDAADGVLAAIFQTTTTSNGKTLALWSQSDEGGEVASLGNLVFTPNRPSEHPALILWSAKLELEAMARLQLSTMKWLTVPVLAVGVPDAAKRIAAMGPLDELAGLL